MNQASRREDGVHTWLVVNYACQPENPLDPLLQCLIDDVRKAYGESIVVDIADPDPAVAARFDTDAIVRGFRLGLPDPAAQGKKPQQLMNHRSETCEVLARRVLADHAGFEFPAAPQQVKVNANQPVLGFDGWGFALREGSPVLVLVLVKGTEDPERPPDVSRQLVAESNGAPVDASGLSRALSVLLQLLRGTRHEEHVLSMLEALGLQRFPVLVVSPVIIRGLEPSHAADLTALVKAAADSTVAYVGVTASVGTALGSLGATVMDGARAA